jgi:uncharacterized SAM-binding protein YcdF (DUF218 family)
VTATFFYLLETLLLPPAALIVLGFVGIALLRHRRRLASVLITSSLSLLYLVSTPLFADWALGLLSPPYSDPREQTTAQAIVLLGGGTFGLAPEYGGDTVNHRSLARLRYAARLHRLTGKPILASGGSVSGETTAEARQMQAILTHELHVPVRWIEDRSRDTLGNALETRRILAPSGITTIYLVTHAWHIPRAKLAFEHAGFAVIPAPIEFSSLEDLGIRDFVPRASALHNSYYFFHEVFGYLWYIVKTRI